MKILFVCTANQCRSPMAEFMFKHLVAQAGLGDQHQIGSAGTWAREGIDMVPEIKQVLTERKIPFSHHRSRNLNQTILAAADVALTMETGHKEALQMEFPNSRDKIYLLTEYVGPPYEIRDPMGRPYAAFLELALELELLLNKLLNKIAA